MLDNSEICLTMYKYCIFFSLMLSTLLNADEDDGDGDRTLEYDLTELR
jgi:hypothetical protein